MTEIEINDLRASLRRDENMFMSLEASIAAKRRDLAQASCPFKVGDITENVGWTYRGRSMRVDSIAAGSSHGYQGDWVVCGHMFKKDNTLSSLTCTFTHRDYEASKKIKNTESTMKGK